LEQIAVRIGEAVKICGISRSKLYEEIKAGRLRARKCGRATLLLVSELRLWVEAQPQLDSGPKDRA